MLIFSDWIMPLIMVIIIIWWIRRRRIHIVVDDENVSSPRRSWNVSAGYDNALNAAQLLQKTHNKTITFFRHLIRRYHIDETDEQIIAEGDAHYRGLWTIAGAYDGLGGDLRKRATAMVRNYNPDTLSENDPKISAETSYTVAKGRRMLACVRNRDNPNILSDPNTLMFTHLHELSHIANYNGWGHGPDFWTTFKWVLREAVEAGVYDPVDYAANPIVFCGLTINYQPLYDANLPSW